MYIMCILVRFNIVVSPYEDRCDQKKVVAELGSTTE